MITTARAHLLLACIAVVFATVTPGQTTAQTGPIDDVIAELELVIHEEMRIGKIPSASFAIVEGDHVVWTGAYGFSNVWAQTPARPQTVYLIGSIYKSLSTAGLLRLMEQGKFQLDDPVHDYLDTIDIRDEEPLKPVTFRHILTHTSGMPAAFGRHPVWGDTVPPTIHGYLQESLCVVGPPLEAVRYSNMAYTLVAHLVEKLSGTPYRQYQQENVFDLLEMTDTAFQPTPQMEERLAIPYVVDGSTGEWRPVGRLKADVWPAGIIYGTVIDLSKWLTAALNEGVYGEERILRAETLDLMFTRQYEKFKGPIGAGWGNEEAGYGLTFWTATQDGERCFAHSGSSIGYTAFLEGNADRKIGIVMLTNGNRAHAYLVKIAREAMALMKKRSMDMSGGR